MLSGDCLKRVLRVDLTSKTFRVEERPDLFDRWLGGAGVAAQLLFENCPEGADPLGPENPIIMAVGPLTSLFPLASKTVAMFKSPHNGNLGESHCGGRSAVAIRMAGYGALVISGKSDRPIYLAIHGNEVRFRDAATLWGMASSFTVGRTVRECEPGPGMRTIMRIGRAGERLVSYACVTTESYRHFGRLGLGAVFGSKNLKALVISGKRSLPVADSRGYRELYDAIYQAAVGSEVMKKYHDLGTAGNVLPLDKIGGLPTRNLKSARFEAAAKISGEALAAGYLGRRLACAHCPVGCIHIAALREPYAEEAFFYKTSMISYDHEPIYAVGTLLGMTEPEGFLKLMDRIEHLGMDVMSAGAALAWATEALERGLVSTAETDGVPLAWGDSPAYIQAVERIVTQPNEFYATLARGLARAAARYGGEDYALVIGGNEMPGYHTGPATHAGVFMGARHSHLDNGGYATDQKAFQGNKRPTAAELAKTLVDEERWRQVLSSLVICFFARNLYDRETTRKALALAGFDLGDAQLDALGADIHAEKYRFKSREGFALDAVRIPKRILETPSALGVVEEGYLRETLDHARRLIAERATAR